MRGAGFTIGRHREFKFVWFVLDWIRFRENRGVSSEVSVRTID